MSLRAFFAQQSLSLYMPDNLLIALQITALGMGLVFAAILLLWLMMTLLTTLLADKKPEADSQQVDLVMENDIKAQAAAIAVTVALAEQQLSSEHPLVEPPTAIVSAWQLGMRTKQLYQKGELIKRNPHRSE
jgi:Na+-transporting methylmalonyl-CoA/oxaloacetate decarboxylase gamma subunit